MANYTDKIILPKRTTGEAIANTLAMIGYAEAGSIPSVDSWDLVQRAVRNGLAASWFPVGTQFVVPHDTYGDLVWDVIGHDQDTPVDPAYTHTMALQLHYALPQIQFSQAQANYKIGTTIAAGDWCIQLIHPDYADGLDTYYDFTSDIEMAVGGLLRISFTDPTYYVDYYAPTNKELGSPTKSYELTAGEVNTKLTTQQIGTQNYSTRVKSGSNRWQYSSVRKWLNSSAAAGAWYPTDNDGLGDYSLIPTNPVYTTNAGFLNGMDAEFLAIVGNVTKRTSLATIMDGATTNTNDSDIGVNDYVDLTEQFFLLSKYEVNSEKSNYIAEGEPYTYYAQNGSATDNSVFWRIKYYDTWIVSTSWIRTPKLNHASVPYAISASGSISSSNAATFTYQSILPACVIL